MDFNGEDESTCCLEDSLVSHTPWQGQEEERKMTDTYGRRCLESFGRFNHVGSWAKMFSDFLIGTREWYSTKSTLIWKLRATKSNRMYFQLVVKTHPTSEHGSSLLLTPTSVQTCEHPDKMRERAERNGYKNGTRFGSLTSQVVHGDMLPTPNAFDWNTARNPETYEAYRKKKAKEGVNFQMPLKQVATNGMLPTPIAGDWKGQRRADGTASMLSGKASLGILPTPVARDWKGKQAAEYQKHRGEEMAVKTKSLTGHLEDIGVRGQTSQLSPLFVGEMMGFPETWLTSPFLDGERSPSKHSETP